MLADAGKLWKDVVAVRTKRSMIVNAYNSASRAGSNRSEDIPIEDACRNHRVALRRGKQRANASGRKW